jgi:hypothetical protein
MQAELSPADLNDCDGVNALVDVAIPDSQGPVEDLADIDQWLSRFVSWRINPNAVKVSDFNFQFFVPAYDEKFVGTKALYVALKHKSSEKCQAFGLKPFVRSHYATAVALTQLAVSDEE